MPLSYNGCRPDGVKNMRKYLVLQTFKSWIAQNRSRFKYRPYLFLVRWNYFEFRFSGITPLIHGRISKNGNVEIPASYKGEFLDILTEFDVSKDHTLNGQYYCTERLEPEMFLSKDELWIRHSFEPLLEWINNEFNESRWLCLFESKGHSTRAVFMDAREAEQASREEDFVNARPVVRKRINQGGANGNRGYV